MPASPSTNTVQDEIWVIQTGPLMFGSVIERAERPVRAGYELAPLENVFCCDVGLNPRGLGFPERITLCSRKFSVILARKPTIMRAALRAASSLFHYSTSRDSQEET